MLIWLSSANLMSNGVLSAVKRDSTGSGTRTTRKLVAFWPTLLAYGLIKPVVNCWRCLPFYHRYVDH